MATVTKLYIGVGDGPLSTSKDLTDGTIWRLRMPGLTITPNGDGTVTLNAPVRLQAANAAAFLGEVADVNELLNMASVAVMTGYGDWVTLSVLFAGAGSTYTYFDVLRGRIELPDSYLPDSIARGTLTAVCLPYGRTAPAVIENYFLQSEDLNTTWTKSNVTVTTNATTAPDGTSTADKILEAATTSVHELHQAVTVANATGTYTMSGYFKSDVRTKVMLQIKDTTAGTVPAQCIFDLATGTAGTPTAGTATMTLEQNGFYRCTVTCTVAHATLDGFVSLITGTSTTSYLGVITSGLYGWGIQLAESARFGGYLRVGASRTWTNGDAPVAMYGVGGDADALCQARFATTAPRIRASRRSHRNAVAADWTPWVDMTTTPFGASNVADATAMGGAYKRRSVSAAAWGNIATATLPTGARDKGRGDIFARVRDTPVAIGTPTTLLGTVTDPAATSVTAESTTEPNGISIVNTESGSSTGNGASGTASFTPTPATTLHNFLVAEVIARQASAAPNTFTINPPAGWVQIKALTSAPGVINAWLYVRENSASLSAIQTWTITRATGAQTWDAAVIFHEIGTVPTSGVIDAFDMQAVAADDPTFNISMSGDGQLVLGFVGAASTTAGVTPTLYLGGESEETSVGALASFSDVRDASGSMSGTTVYATTPTAAIITVLSLSPTYTTTPGATTVTPPAGAGALGTGVNRFIARVQAVDSSGALSNSTTSLTKSVANGYGSIAYTWTAPATGLVAYYRLTVSDNVTGLFYAFNTPDATPAYTVADLSLGASVAALPATSGAVPTFNRFRAVVNGAALDTEVQVPVSGTWYLLHFGTAVLGATGRALDGTQGGGTVTIQGYNAGGSAAPMEVDALFLPAHDEPSVVVETSDLTASTGLTVAESHRRETHTLAWQAPSGGPVTTVSAGSVAAGLLTLAPNENLIGLALDTTAGVSDMSLTAIPAFQVWQRTNYLMAGVS